MHIQTHTPGEVYPVPHFFIEATGYNAGRPALVPSADCYAITANDAIQMEKCFWICFGLWETNCFIKMLDKGMPPKLDQSTVTMLIDKSHQLLAGKSGDFAATVKEINNLIRTEKLLKAQMGMIKKIKKSVAKKLIGR